MNKRLFLLDGHSLAHRAFYALPLLTNSDGEYTNAVFGFCRMLFKLIDDENPELLAVAFDKKAPTFRHKEYEDYKANRKKMPDELSPQIGLIKEVLKALKIPIFEIEGYEADDVIGTLAREGEAEGMDAVIVTGDRDSLQLVTDKVNVLYTRKGISDIVKYNLDRVRKDYELEPSQLIDMKGLMGDNSDNIPGVPGIGEKTATSLLKEFSSMENILENIDRVSGKKRKENLHKYADQARLSKRLGEIITNVPLEIDLQECRIENPEEEEIIDLFQRLEFTSLLDRFQQDREIEVEEVKVKEIKAETEINALIKDIKKRGRFAFEFLMDDLNRPVRAKVEKMIIALDEKNLYQIEYREGLPGSFKEVFAQEKIKKYIINSKEVLIFLKKKGLKLEGLEFDPLLVTYLLHPSNKLPSFEELLKSELNLFLPEEISRTRRSAVVLSSLFKIIDRLTGELEKNDLLNLYYEIELPLIKVLAELELNGINLDRDYLKELSDRWEKELEQIRERVYKLSGAEFNLNSPKQLGEILFEKLGLPVIKKTKTGYSTSARVLEELEDKHEIIPLIMDYRQLMKLKSTYVDALPPLINPETERIHTSFNQMVTATGRLSSTEPNLQNIPIRSEEGREIRKAFVPRYKDWLLLAADYSQVELRVLAHISGDENLITAFNRGEDIHTQTAGEIFEVKPEEVTASMRRHAKVINFGIAYGMSPYGLARDLKISRKEAEDYINRYFNRFSGVKKYMDEIVKQAKEEGYVTTIFNRKRYIPEIRSRNYHRRSFAERTAINTPIQGSAADIMKIAMIKVYDRLQEENFKTRMMLQVHDEVVLDVFKENLKEVAVLVKEEMEGAVDLAVPLTVDIQSGDNWKDKRELEL